MSAKDHFGLGQRVLAESLGTGLLLVAVVGSGIMASRLAKRPGKREGAGNFQVRPVFPLLRREID